MNLEYSLVLATVDRTAEPRQFLESLDRQKRRNFELVVVDQNIDRRLDDLIESYTRRFRVTHVKIVERGLSHARNIGMAHATGEIFAFPDDDCKYPPNLLDSVSALFREHPDWDGVTGRGVGESREPGPKQWSRTAATLGLINLWRMSRSYTIFLRRAVIERVGAFDETLGVGALTRWGSGEESDYLARALKTGFEIHYEPRVSVHHSQSEAKCDERSIVKAYSYALGQGRVLRAHGYPLWWIAYRSLRSLGGSLLAAGKGQPRQARYHFAVLRGRLEGWASR